VVEPARFEKEVIVPRTHDPMQLEVLPDGRIYFIERSGPLKLFDPAGGRVELVGRVPSVRYGEVGLMGLKLDPAFENNRQLYLFFCPKAKKDHLRLSRFELKEGKLDLDSEIVMLEYPIEPEGATHMGGGMAWDTAGNLYIGTGDNCVPIPQPPLDQRPGHEAVDALRSAGNTHDLRGKVLRIHPEPDGSYTIPGGNLFADPKGGRAEIYTMGVRNAFRIFVDPETDWLYWGDVGPNVRIDLDAGPNGYDEVNQARRAGNFGWPMFVGANEPYRRWDFATGKPGAWFDLNRRLNDSKNNTGARVLPPAEPAWIWYPTTESKQFPELGSGGRAAMAGPVYHYDAASGSELRLPATLDGKLLIYDWTRNWIKAVQFDPQGGVKSIEPFMPEMIFRKPIDMKFHADGTLYLIEYGDKWNDNHDAQIVRIVYRRGNRPPVASNRADQTAGKQPLTIRFDGSDSYDKDVDDRLQYAWRIEPSDAVLSRKLVLEHTFSEPGTHRVTLTVTDRSGDRSESSSEIRVGNAPPEVAILEPPSGSFFSWEEPIGYRTRVTDAEDGDTGAGSIDRARVVVRAKYQQRRSSTQVDGRGRQLANDDAALEPGLALMRGTTCFACHMTGTASAGPAYGAVAARYREDPEAHGRLAEKIIAGGSGTWGQKPMPPHPQHTLPQTRQMVDWILSLTSATAHPPMPGSEGAFRTCAHPDGRGNAGVYVITASYTDDGAEGVAAITGEAVHVLHSRLKKAAFFDTRRGVELIDEYEGEHTIVGHFADGDYVSFTGMRLAGIDRVTLRAAALGEAGGRFELRSSGPDGPLLAEVPVPPGSPYRAIQVHLKDPGGLIDLYLVARAETAAEKKSLGLNWLVFHDSKAETVARKARQEAAEAVLASRQSLQSRPFVRDWQLDDLREKLALAERGRSFENGQRLFELATCASCHRMGAVGGPLGPELTDVAGRLAQAGPEPRLRLLEEILHPSRQIADRYRTIVIGTLDGKQLSGIVVENETEGYRLVNNPQTPKTSIFIPRSEIERIDQSQISLMPAGLLSTFTLEDIMDLLAYLEAGGKKEHPAFGKE
jgi:cytochrome c